MGDAPGAEVCEQVRYEAEPGRILAVVTDPAWLRTYAAALGARVQAVESAREDGVRRTSLRLGVPTGGIPPVFTRFVGAEVTVDDVRTWRPASAGGFAADVELRARILGRTALVRGRQTLAAEAGGTLATTTAAVSIDAPVVGRQAEAAVRQLVGVVLRREEELLRRHLTGGT